MAGARVSARCQKWANPEGFVAFSTTTTTTPHYALIHYATTTTYYICTPTLHSSTLHYTTLQLHYTTFHYATLHTLWSVGCAMEGWQCGCRVFTFFCRVLVRTVQGVSLVSWSSGDPFFAARTKGSLRCSVSIQAAHGARIPSTKSRPFSISQERPERRRAGSGFGPQKICMSIIAEWWGQPLDVWQSAGFHQSGRAPCRNKHCSSRYHRQNMSVLKLNQGYEGFCEPCFVSAVQCNLRRCQ